MMRADAGLHPAQARRQVGKWRVDLATRPFLPEYDRTTPIVPYDVERILADIDADHGNCAARFLRHGVLLFGAPSQASITGGAGARPDHPITGHRRPKSATGTPAGLRNFGVVPGVMNWAVLRDFAFGSTHICRLSS